MRIKKYNNFLIKESFTSSDDYYDFLRKVEKDTGINKEFFTDSLLEVSDISSVRISYHCNLYDIDGKIINENISKDSNHKIVYSIIIDHNIKVGEFAFDEFTSKLSELNTITNSILEMIDRCISKIKLKSNKVVTSGKNTFIISFENDIDNDELRKYYNAWGLHYNTPEYIKGILKLEKMYDDVNINLYDYMDTLDDEMSIQIGFFGDDEELYAVASFNRSTKRFSIDEDEFLASVQSFKENN